jgi:hypothetical protein
MQGPDSIFSRQLIRKSGAGLASRRRLEIRPMTSTSYGCATRPMLVRRKGEAETLEMR